MIEIETSDIDEAAFLQSIQRLKLVAIEPKEDSRLVNFIFAAENEAQSAAVRAAWANGNAMVPARRYGKAVNQIKGAIRAFWYPDEHPTTRA